jgi:PucR family transcriptional regulator, purine catabolism regulatory protein
MVVTLSALVRHPSLGLTVVTGHEALNREITWVHASELPDPTPYLDGGELLLSVGMWLRRGTAERTAGRAHAAAYVDRLVRTGAAGLGFGIGLTHAQVPRALIDAASDRGLPLLLVPEKTPFIAIGRVVWEAMAADQSAEITHTFRAHQELTRAAVAGGAGGLVRRLAERLGGWVVLLDTAGSVVHAAPAGAARQAPWLAEELERLRDYVTPVSTTLSVDGDQIVLQSLRPERRTRGFLAVGVASRPTAEQRDVLNTAVSLLTLVLAQASALRSAEAHLRTAILELLVNGDLDRANRLAVDMWGGLPDVPVRLSVVAGASAAVDDFTDVLDAAGGSSPEQLFFATVGDRVAIIYPANARMRDRVLALASASAALTVGESTETQLTDVRRAYNEADQALGIGVHNHRQHTQFADIGASAMLELLATPQATAFAESLLRPLIDHDASGRGDLVTSLMAWLDHNGQWDAAAAELGVHRHTLRHRMRRVSELLRRDLDIAAVRVELWTAVRLLRQYGPH